MSEIGQIKGAAAIVSGDEKDETTLGVATKDDKTFVVELETQVPFFMTLMYFPIFYPLNEQFYTSLKEGAYGTSPDTFLSCGAFNLTSYSLGTANLLLQKNPTYWNADAIALDSLTYQVVGSSDSALMAFESNYLDIVMIGGDQVAVAREDVSLKDKLKATISGILHFLTFSQTKKNAQGGMLANTNLRLAISNAIDREALVKNYVDDGSQATYTAVPPHYALSATTGEDFSADQAMFSEWIGYDPKRAQEFFEHAKAELKTDAFEFTLIYSNNEGDEIEKVA